MQICVHLDPARLFRWHLALLPLLRDAGHDVAVSFGDNPEPLPNTLTAILDYDQARSHKAASETLSSRLHPHAFEGWPRYAGGGYGVMLDLSTASRVHTHPGRVLRPLFDGSYKDYALFDALLRQHAPQLSLADSRTRDHVWIIGQPAIEMPWRAGRSFDEIASRLTGGIVRALNEIAAGRAPQGILSPEKSTAGRSNLLAGGAAFAGRRLGRKFSRLAEVARGTAPRWHVAWRRSGEDDAPLQGDVTLNLCDYRVLPDDGQRYFADPFVIAHEGAAHVFVEELPSATGRGIISHFVLDASGQPSPVTRVLETDVHLSYPFVFRDGADFYMLPEASASGGLDLYRATRFPHAWEKLARVIDTPVHDATVFTHDGRWWIAAGTQELQSSSWDGLSLFYAGHLHGPWTAHPMNPVLVDAGGARPAGALWRTADGSLMRPAQDCRTGYGHALAVRRITRLDPEGFADEPAGHVSFARGLGIFGPHTLSRAAGFELIDLYAGPGALRTGDEG